VTPSIRTLGTVLAMAAIGAATGCGSDTGTTTPAKSGTIAVVATTPEVADFTRNVGGDAVSVTQIIKPNVDPHDYEPTPADIQAVGAAKLVIKNGVGLDSRTSASRSRTAASPAPCARTCCRPSPGWHAPIRTGIWC
jgi:zinc/manganese transport system substrate-binding protein